MKRSVLLILLPLIFLAASCVRKTDWTLQTDPGHVVVVNAVVTDEIGEQKITLTYPVVNLNDPPAAVTGANVLITETDSVYQLTENPPNSGIYLTPMNFLAKPGRTYTLLIYKGNQFFTAKAAMEQGFTFNPFQYSPNDDDSLFHVDYVASIFSTENPAMWEILLDWSKVPGYEQADFASCTARLLFYTLPTLDVSEIFAPEVQKINFPKGTSVTEKRYSLSAGYAEFIREMLLETTWQGGIFNTAPANLSTNLSTGATGYFAVCSVNSLYFFIGNEKK
jgi:hypothetical protein